jgi:hypothetical protein
LRGNLTRDGTVIPHQAIVELVAADGVHELPPLYAS